MARAAISTAAVAAVPAVAVAAAIPSARLTASAAVFAILEVWVALASAWLFF